MFIRSFIVLSAEEFFHDFIGASGDAQDEEQGGVNSHTRYDRQKNHHFLPFLFAGRVNPVRVVTHTDILAFQMLVKRILANSCNLFLARYCRRVVEPETKGWL